MASYESLFKDITIHMIIREVQLAIIKSHVCDWISRREL